ncbi:MAG: outer membrane lipoprotein chaperone LolA [Casimicrobiaceae bacterium]
MNFRGRTVVLVVALGAGMLGAVGVAGAAGLDQLRAFLENTRSGQTRFVQTVTVRSGRPPAEASGVFAFARPGRFRWTYEKPFKQLIVGDGEKLWIFDQDLNQVIVKKLGQALGSSPAALLAGDNALERNFTLTGGIASDGLEWVVATPKAADSGFQEVRIGFADNLPRRMDLTDSFGQVTHLGFTGFERNAAVDTSQFRFTPPRGADVVGE